jgi:hypothetical protein
MQLAFGTTPTTVGPVGHHVAKTFVKRWHYSRMLPTGMNISLGWALTDGTLYTVAVYGIGVNPHQAAFLAKLTGEPIDNANLLELKRLCRIEPSQVEYPMSAFLSRCHKILRRMGYNYIVAFSDPEQGHDGGVYKASNFTYLGKTNAEVHTVDTEGHKRHRRYPFRFARRNNITIGEARMQLDLTPITTLPKDRWFIRIG